MAIVKRRYRNPPVVETLCSVHFTSGTWDETVPGIFLERVKSIFPCRRSRSALDLASSAAERQPSGWSASGVPLLQLESQDGSRVVQLGRDLLVVNQLRPYPGFEAWLPVLLDQVALYRELARPAGGGRTLQQARDSCQPGQEHGEQQTLLPRGTRPAGGKCRTPIRGGTDGEAR